MDFDFTLETISPNVSTLLNVGGTGALQLPSGITTARPGTAVAGAIRWNTTVPQLEYYNGSAWIASGGSVTSITLATGSTGLTVNAGTSATITSSGTFTIAGTLATGYGGTGLATIGTANQIFGVNTSATGLEYKTLASGGGIIITPTAGNISLATRNSLAPTSVIYVSKSGNDTTGNGSWDNPFLTVVKGCTVAATLANSTNQVTVFVINGIYSETNPIAISNENIMVQGQDVGSVFIQPITNGQPLFNLSSATAGEGPTLNYLTVRGPSGYSAVAGGSLVRVSGDGYFELVNVYIDSGYTGIDCGYGTITAGQTVEWVGGDADGNNITVNAQSSAVFLAENFTSRGITTASIQASGTAIIKLNGYLIQGFPQTGSTTPIGTGISTTGSAGVLATSGQIIGFVTGLLAAGTSNTRILSTYFANNTYDFNQSTSTAVVQIQGVYSATNPLITNGSNVALNYIDINTNDYIVGSAVSTGVPGKVFRVRDYDGRVAVGDNATDANIASGPATPSGSRSINLIDTNGNMRIWRFIATAGLDPSFELIKGINPANADADGQAPITSIVAATDTITINVAGTNFNGPLASPPGIDRTTLAGRAFPAGRTFQVSGTASNNGTFTVVSSTYNSGPQTISIVVTTNITVSEGAVGTVVFGGGAGRLDGPNPGNAGAAVAAGTGNVWWDSFLQESDYMVFRRRTGGGGGLTNEKLRIYPDHSEFLGASTYSDSDNALIFTAQNTAGAVNYLTLQNSITATPVLINAAGTDTDVSISLIPKGAGVVTAGGTRGLVAPSGTTAQQPATPVNGTIRYNTTTSLMEFRQNGVWVNITAGGGTVTSVSTSGGTTGLTLTTTNPTTTPSIVLAGTLAATNGGTGQTVYAIGDILYASTTTALSRLADVAVGSYLRSGGVGVAPLWSTLTLPNAATTGDLLYATGTNAIGNLADVATGNALISGGVGAAPSWGKISLTTAISGILPIANGGTALSTTPTNGQLLIGNGTGYTLASITGSTGLSVTPGAGTIALANTGVTSNVAGTGIAVSGATGAVTVSLATVGTAGTYGQVTTDAYGRVTAGGVNSLTYGGTNAALTAVNGAVVYSTASAMALTTAGTTGQVLTSNGAAAPTWATVGAASYSVNVGPAGTIAWTLVSGTTYTATITHNLGTQNVVVQTTDISNNQITYADLITITSATQIIVQVSGAGSNLKTLRTVIIANGASIAAGASTPSSVIVQNNGVALTGTYTTLNLIGPLTATNAGAGVATITDSVTTIRTLSYFATSLDSPNNADWVINALAPTVADPTNAGITVRQFSNTVEQGVGLSVPIPSGATNITFTYRGRSASATAGTLQMRYYSRAIASATPAAVSAWSAANNLTSVASPANVFFQTFTYTATLASLSLTAGNMYQFEFTRNVGVAGNLAFNWLMVELDVSFT